MDSMRTFDGYGRVDELQHQAVQMKRPHQRLMLIAISSIVLVAILAISIVCYVTRYPNMCFSSILPVLEETPNATNPREILSLSLQVAVGELLKVVFSPWQYTYNIGDEAAKMALEDCSALFDYAVSHLNDSISIVALNGSMQGSNERSLSTKAINDLKISLGSAMTRQGRCLDKLDKLNETTTLVEGFKGLVKNSTEFVTNSLEIVTNFDFILLISIRSYIWEVGDY
ncbi:hypothetical protein Ancab_000455 [Ancistrocladus abbreviatus]